MLKKIKIYFTILALAILSVILLSACSSNVTGVVIEPINEDPISMEQIGFNQWISVKFFGGDVSFSEAIASAENKCLIIKKGSMQFDNNSVKKTFFIKDGFGNVFGINIETVYPNVTTGQSGVFIPAGNISITKETYNQLWTTDKNPSWTESSIRGSGIHSNVIYLHLTAEQIGFLYDDYIP